MTSTSAATTGCSRAAVRPGGDRILITLADSKPDWLRAGQALLHAANRWVSASLHTQPLESPP